MESVYSIQHRRRHRFSYWNLPLGFANKVPVSHDAFKLIQSQFSPVQWLHLQKNSIQSLSLSLSLLNYLPSLEIKQFKLHLNRLKMHRLTTKLAWKEGKKNFYKGYVTPNMAPRLAFCWCIELQRVKVNNEFITFYIPSTSCRRMYSLGSRYCYQYLRIFFWWFLVIFEDFLILFKGQWRTLWAIPEDLICNFWGCRRVFFCWRCNSLHWLRLCLDEPLLATRFLGFFRDQVSIWKWNYNRSCQCYAKWRHIRNVLSFYYFYSLIFIGR